MKNQSPLPVCFNSSLSRPCTPKKKTNVRFTRHRRLVAFVFPGLLAHIIWWSYAATHPSAFDLFTADTAGTPNWYMCITMAFGSMVAGATSEVRRTIGKRLCRDGGSSLLTASYARRAFVLERLLFFPAFVAVPAPGRGWRSQCGRGKGFSS